MKHEMRLNDRRVSILTIPRFCPDSIPALLSVCPIHKFWSVIRTSYATGIFLIDAVRPGEGDLNRVLTAATITESIPGAPLYTLNGFRRVYATDVGRCGSTLAAIWGVFVAAAPRF